MGGWVVGARSRSKAKGRGKWAEPSAGRGELWCCWMGKKVKSGWAVSVVVLGGEVWHSSH